MTEIQQIRKRLEDIEKKIAKHEYNIESLKEELKAITQQIYQAVDKASKKDRDDGNNHPTVKPTELMRYLCRLVTPQGGVVLDPFMGSGSTGKGALLEGFKFIGIEMEREYFDIACARLEAVQKNVQERL